MGPSRSSASRFRMHFERRRRYPVELAPSWSSAPRSDEVEALAIACAITAGVAVSKSIAPPGAVALEPVADVEVLLEVVAEREVEERPPVGGQLHRGRQPALDDREVAGGQVAVEVVDVGAHLEPVGVLGERGRVDARPGDDDHPQLGHELLRLREGVDDAPEQVAADPRSRRR